MDWEVLISSWSEGIYDDIELAKAIQERALLFWQQLSRFVVLASKLAEVAESGNSETPVIEGSHILKSVKITTGRRKSKTRTSYDTAAFKVLGDLAKA